MTDLLLTEVQRKADTEWNDMVEEHPMDAARKSLYDKTKSLLCGHTNFSPVMWWETKIYCQNEEGL